jgi:hypothetical protein
VLLRFEGPAGRLLCGWFALRRPLKTTQQVIPMILLPTLWGCGNGYHPDDGFMQDVVGITVKIVRAHGGCLGTWSR